MLPVRGQERILAIISDWAGRGGTHQVKWCGWATEMMKSSKNTVVSIKKYAKITFPIPKYTIVNRKYALDRKFMSVHQNRPKDLQLDSKN